MIILITSIGLRNVEIMVFREYRKLSVSYSSSGAHGLRHSYAQTRYEELANHYARHEVLTIISQELGHFREDITEVYLR